MVDWESAAIGAASSLLVSLFVFHYQNWKSNVRARVSIFYQARKQIKLNLEALALSTTSPDRKDLLLEKIQFLPTYPFSDSNHVGDGFRALTEYYDEELLRAVSGEKPYAEFERTSRSQIHLMDMMIGYWGEILQSGTILDYIGYWLLWRFYALRSLWMHWKSKVKGIGKYRQDKETKKE